MTSGKKWLFQTTKNPGSTSLQHGMLGEKWQMSLPSSCIRDHLHSVCRELICWLTKQLLFPAWIEKQSPTAQVISSRLSCLAPAMVMLTMSHLVYPEGNVAKASLFDRVLHQLPVHGPELVKFI